MEAIRAAKAADAAAKAADAAAKAAGEPATDTPATEEDLTELAPL